MMFQLAERFYVIEFVILIFLILYMGMSSWFCTPVITVLYRLVLLSLIPGQGEPPPGSVAICYPHVVAIII